MELGTQERDHVRVAVLAGERDRRIAGKELLQPEDQDRDEEQRRDDQRQALQQVVQHSMKSEKGLQGSPPSAFVGGPVCILTGSPPSRGRRPSFPYFICRPCTRTMPSGTVRSPVSFAVCAQSQLR